MSSLEELIGKRKKARDKKADYEKKLSKVKSEINELKKYIEDLKEDKESISNIKNNINSMVIWKLTPAIQSIDKAKSTLSVLYKGNKSGGWNGEINTEKGKVQEVKDNFYDLIDEATTIISNIEEELKKKELELHQKALKSASYSTLIKQCESDINRYSRKIEEKKQTC